MDSVGQTWKRLRLAEADLKRRPGSRLEALVAVERDGRTFRARAEGTGLEAVELRIAAEATLAAIGEATGAGPFQLVGVKRLHAFDADVIVAALRAGGEDGQRYIGAVPVRTTAIRGVAAAVLDATNRIMFAPEMDP